MKRPGRTPFQQSTTLAAAADSREAPDCGTFSSWFRPAGLVLDNTSETQRRGVFRAAHEFNSVVRAIPSEVARVGREFISCVEGITAISTPVLDGSQSQRRTDPALTPAVNEGQGVSTISAGSR
ncbi:hypothetical protein BaRGS_00022652 [Batillaria attramentaria]|uniref:Uncharacterized protein n=1 Tax=Batillaria attramentaria TaxID=370345 RepID=A0ABD0KFV7_9CAEN